MTDTEPPFAPRADADTRPPAAIRGRALLETSSRRLEPHHPSFVASHPTACGLIWIAVAIAGLVVCDAVGGPGWARALITLTAALPSLIATLVVLSQTPRSHLEYEESILTHFFTRFLGLVTAFVFWIGSVVIGAAIAVQLAADSGTNVAAAWVEAAQIFAGVVPPVAILLYCGLIVRYVSYLVRLRGWSAVPSRHRIPAHFLAELPRSRRIVVGLAHPGLLLIAGLLTTLLAIALAVDIDIDGRIFFD